MVYPMVSTTRECPNFLLVPDGGQSSEVHIDHPDLFLAGLSILWIPKLLS